MRNSSGTIAATLASGAQHLLLPPCVTYYLLEIAGESRNRLTRRQHQGQEAVRSPGFGEQIEVVAELNTTWEVLRITVCRCQPREVSYGVG